MKEKVKEKVKERDPKSAHSQRQKRVVVDKKVVVPPPSSGRVTNKARSTSARMVVPLSTSSASSSSSSSPTPSPPPPDTLTNTVSTTTVAVSNKRQTNKALQEKKSDKEKRRKKKSKNGKETTFQMVLRKLNELETEYSPELEEVRSLSSLSSSRSGASSRASNGEQDEGERRLGGESSDEWEEDIVMNGEPRKLYEAIVKSASGWSISSHHALVERSPSRTLSLSDGRVSLIEEEEEEEKVDEVEEGEEGEEGGEGGEHERKESREAEVVWDVSLLIGGGMEQVHSFDLLPSELLIHIFSFLDLSTLLTRVSCVKRSWWSIIDDQEGYGECWRGGVDLSQFSKTLSSRHILSCASKFRGVEKISLRRCEGVCTRGFQHLFTMCKRVREIDLTGCINLDGRALSTLSASHAIKNLELLNLTSCQQLTDDDLRCLSPPDDVSHSLHGLKLNRCRLITDTSLHHLSKGSFYLGIVFCSCFFSLSSTPLSVCLSVCLCVCLSVSLSLYRHSSCASYEPTLPFLLTPSSPQLHHSLHPYTIHRSQLVSSNYRYRPPDSLQTTS